MHMPDDSLEVHQELSIIKYSVKRSLCFRDKRQEFSLKRKVTLNTTSKYLPKNRHKLKPFGLVSLTYLSLPQK